MNTYPRLSYNLDLTNSTLELIKEYLTVLRSYKGYISVADLDGINDTYLNPMSVIDSIDKGLLNEVEDLFQEVYNKAYEQ